MNLLSILILLLPTVKQTAPPDSISLQYCYKKAYTNYPIAQNIELQKRITDLNTDIANTGYLPQVSVNGKASYQSEVTEFGGGPSLSKDQYEASANVIQAIFNGGAIGIRKELEQLKGNQEVNSTRVDLHKIRSQIDQVYYGILLSRQQSKTIELLADNLRERLKTIRSQVKNGVLLPSQQHILHAELIKSQQDSANVQSNIRAGYAVLGKLIGEEVRPETQLILPQAEVSYQSLEPLRPEYDLFRSSSEVLEEQKKLIKTSRLPSLSAFGTLSYGRPGFNFLNDDFHEYYIVGLRLQWKFWDTFNSSHKIKALDLQQQKIEANRKAFTRQLNAALDRISERITALRENIDRDKKIIKLREQIVKESASQLENGVITATEYVTELTEANKAQLSLFINKVQLSQAQTDYKTTLGTTIND